MSHFESEETKKTPTLRSSSGLNADEVDNIPQRSKKSKSSLVVFFNGLITLLFIGFLAAGAALYMGKNYFESPGPLESDKSILISNGTNSEGIANALVSQGIINNKWVFLGGAYAYRSLSQMKAGEYVIEAGSSMHDVMKQLVEGKAILHSITIPEGWSSQQVVEHINAQEMLSGQITETPAEGSILPETYKFSRNSSAEQILKRMMQSRDKVVDDIWAKMKNSDTPISSKNELITLASIVEKETARADERTRVAAVFLNRLRKGMRIQSDPTILYGLYKGDAWKKPRTILRSELNAPNNIYNTYQISALPPGPIANPGKAALESVANPSRTDDLYFVADGTGGHAFAKTLAEHNRNVARWRKIEKERKNQ